MITQVVSTLVSVGPFCSLAGGKELEIRLSLQGLFLFGSSFRVFYYFLYIVLPQFPKMTLRFFWNNEFCGS